MVFFTGGFLQQLVHHLSYDYLQHQTCVERPHFRNIWPWSAPHTEILNSSKVPPRSSPLAVSILVYSGPCSPKLNVSITGQHNSRNGPVIWKPQSGVRSGELCLLSLYKRFIMIKPAGTNSVESHRGFSLHYTNNARCPIESRIYARTSKLLATSHRSRL